MENYPELTASLKKLVENGKTPGLQYIVMKDRIILYQQNLGVAEFESNKPIEKNSFFNACSVTETFTSLAIVQLAEAGKIKLTDNASVYLDGLPFHEEIKIYQLLSHTSGLSNPNPLRWAHLQSEENKFDSDEFIRNVFRKYNRLKSKPGEKFSYSNLNYLPLGQIIEKVSGLSYCEYIRKNIFARISLERRPMDFIIPDEIHYARGYQKKLTLINLILGFLIDRKKFTTRSGNPAWIKFNKYYASGRAYGGLIANGYSLTKFLYELSKPHSLLLSDAWKDVLFDKQKINNGDEIEMALGWFTGKLNEFHYFGHAGEGAGYYCEMRIYPDSNMYSVIMFNRSGMRDERILDELDRHFQPL
jgi:CubicO group peptidase (beta-lactamase class C family)